MSDDDRSERDRRSPAGSGSGQQESEDRKIVIVNQYRSRSKERSRSRSPSVRKSKRKYSRSRSRSRSRDRKSKNRRRSGSRHRRYSRSYSRSASYSPPSYRRGRGRTHSRSPMSNRRRHNGNRENPEPTRCLGVFGLSIYTTEHQIHHIFSKYGPVENVQIVLDVKTGHSRGFCFVYFENIEDARMAKEQCTGMEVDGRRIRVDYSITQRAHTPTPGIYMGKPIYVEKRYSRDYYRDQKWERGGRDYYGGSNYRSSRYRSPSPYYSSRSRRRYDRSRSRSYTPYY